MVILLVYRRTLQKTQYSSPHQGGFEPLAMVSTDDHMSLPPLPIAGSQCQTSSELPLTSSVKMMMCLNHTLQSLSPMWHSVIVWTCCCSFWRWVMVKLLFGVTARHAKCVDFWQFLVISCSFHRVC